MAAWEDALADPIRTLLPLFTLPPHPPPHPVPQENQTILRAQLLTDVGNFKLMGNAAAKKQQNCGSVNSAGSSKQDSPSDIT